MRPRVWAPDSKAPRIDVAGHRHPLVAAAGGWWESPLDLPPGTAYAFCVDGDQPLPDPRTRLQPEGVHGPSVVEAEEDFTWHDAGWRMPSFDRTVCYELHLGTFSESGTCEGAIPHLDALVELGVTAISLMPVPTFAGERGWGYDGVDLYAPYLPYGGSEGLRRLVDAAHRCGLAVILDCVYNHLGPEGNYLPRFGPYFSARHQTPWGAGLNFDGPGSAGVRDFCIDNAVSWLRDWHLDGLRLDAVHAIVDDSPTHVLAEMRQRVDREVSPDRWLIAECDRLDPRFAGWGLNAQWSDDLHHALHALLTGERTGYYSGFGETAQLVRALGRGYVREPSAPYPGVPDGRRLVVFTQNHDQVGNRAGGERLCHLVSPGQARMAAAWVLLSRFVPMLFMGEEWAASTPFPFFSDHQDPQIARATTEGRRQEFGDFRWRPEDVPDPQAESTFLSARLRWSERSAGGHGEMLAFYRSLLALRRERLGGASEGDDVRTQQGEGWLTVSHGGLTVAANWGPTPARIPAPGDLVLHAGDASTHSGILTLPPTPSPSSPPTNHAFT